jgi:ribosome modulation factor
MTTVQTRQIYVGSRNLNPAGGNAIMFGLCSGIQDLPTGEEPSRHHTWNAFNCGYQAYRQGKVFGANPYYNDDLDTRWSEGWKAAQKACERTYLNSQPS